MALASPMSSGSRGKVESKRSRQALSGARAMMAPSSGPIAKWAINRMSLISTSACSITLRPTTATPWGPLSPPLPAPLARRLL
eukprot:scaffold24117_cov31-Tisochrysis_lutea.AAC.4